MGHVDLPKARAGGMVGGFFALFSPTLNQSLDFKIFDDPPYDIPLPDPMPRHAAEMPVSRQVDIASALEAAGLIRMVRTREDLATDADGPLTVVLHLEGAECIGADLDGLDTLYDAGLRSLGPVWSRPNAFAHGVPFRTGSDGDTGPGLTEAGRALVRECTARGMVVDCSHITAKGFWDIAEEGAPLVATHSNACAVVADGAQPDRCAAQGRGGNGRHGRPELRHHVPAPRRQARAGGRDRFRHPAPRAYGRDGGGGHVGLGSDFDGAPMPEGLGSAAELQTLVEAMRRRASARPDPRHLPGQLDRVSGPAFARYWTGLTGHDRPMTRSKPPGHPVPSGGRPSCSGRLRRSAHSGSPWPRRSCCAAMGRARGPKAGSPASMTAAP
jgi:membrane dipeptidase